MIKLLKFIFHISVLFLIIISLYPGSLFGYFFYGDLYKQPNIIANPFGTAINHFICYICISFLGFFLYLRNKNFQNLFYGLLFLSIFLEVLQFVIPIRTFQWSDLFGNVLGVLVAYFLVKIYQLYIKP